MRTIDGDALLKSIEQNICDGCGKMEHLDFCVGCGVFDAYSCIIHASTIEAEPVRHGHWVWDEKTRDENGIDWGVGAWRCSLCKCKNHNIPENKNEIPLRWAGSKYCPNCNAKMDEVIDDG